MGQQILLAAENKRKFGTCEIGQTYGTVKSATLDESVSEEIWEDCCLEPEAVLLYNHILELSLDVLFEAGKSDTVVMGMQIAFPVAGIYGNVTGISTKWENKKMLTIKAKHWKSLGNRAPITVSCS